MIDLQLWEFPLTLVLMAAYVLVLCRCCKASSSGVLGRLMGRTFAIATIIITVLLVAVEGTWALRLFHSWTFVLAVLLMMIPLAGASAADWRRKMFSAAFFSHVGLLLVLIGGLFGSPDVSDSQMLVRRDKAEHLSYTRNGRIVPLPFKVQLADFRIDYYDDGTSPKQYTSAILVDGQPMETSVNHPCRHDGWDIYQSDYDMEGQRFSVLKVVRDPWLPVVYTGMLLLVIGAVLNVRKVWHNKWVLPAVAALTVVFSLISLARINFGTLVPALRSVWFVPHIIIYMVAYSILAVASVMGLWCVAKKRNSVDLPLKLLTTASSLLLIGMLCGAVWAKAAWGHYWTWDGKECWAAATWMITLIGIHAPALCKRKVVLAAIWLSFLAMQITWYGVNYLPSATNSLHTYNK